MHCKQFNTALLIVLGCLAACGAVRAPQEVATAVQGGFQCGAPNGPCGAAIPAGVQCPKGPGWCQAGYYCGWSKNTDEASRCLPLPESCGKAGHACCPSNTDSPHTSLDDKLNRKPFCKDGSYCLYWPPLRGDKSDIYAGNTGADWGSPGAQQGGGSPILQAGLYGCQAFYQEQHLHTVQQPHTTRCKACMSCRCMLLLLQCL